MIGSAWLEVLDRVLRPARPCLDRCLAERAAHLGSRGASAGVLRRALQSLEHRIDEARTQVFAADDGVVSGRMTALEREWRRLSSPDPEAGLMDLWARVAPAAWLDRKRWRDSEPDARLDTLVALASDPEGVEAAERAVERLRTSLAPYGVGFGPTIRWRPLAEESGEGVAALLGAPLEVARAACPRKIERRVLERGEAVRREVAEAAAQRLPRRPRLVAELGHAALLDVVWQAASLAASSNPAAAWRELLRTGYLLTEVSAAGAMLELPPLASG